MLPVLSRSPLEAAASIVRAANHPALAPITMLGADDLDGLKLHPLSDLFPAPSGDDFNRLYADIAAHGILNPATLCEGMVLCGRARVAIARQLRIACPVIHYEETGHASNPLNYAIAQNTLRAHYSVGQLIMIAAKIANMRQGERTDLQQPSATWPKVSQEEAAKVMGVGVRSVGRGRYILDHGTPDEIEAAVSGKQDPAPLAAIIQRRIEGGQEPEEEDDIDKARAKLLDALTEIGVYRHLHIGVDQIIERLVERRDGETLQKLHKLVDAHNPEQLFAETRAAIAAVETTLLPARDAADGDEADAEE